MDVAFTDHCLFDHFARPSAFTIHVTARSLMIGSLQLGPSALAGFSLFIILAPLQERMITQKYQIRKESMKYTDRRAKTLLEVLGRKNAALVTKNNSK